MSSQLLTNEDLVRVTGKKTHRCQKAWLASVGIPFVVRGDGSVVLTWPAVNYRLIGKEVTNGPDLDGLDRLG